MTMYFPPAGGGGVQRSLKLAQYLPALGIETHVLAPDDPKWVHRDPELRVPTQAWIHRARYVGPRARKPAEELRAAEGLERALVQAQITARRLLLPDASVTWNLTAIPAAIRIARREGIDAVITTSPPGSVHLVGAAVQRASGARWIADLRDPLVANQQRRDDTAAARARQAANEQVARLVARRADAVTCVSEAIAAEMRGLDARGPVRVISNGCDFDDFAGLEYHAGSRFRITHTGSFFGKRDPRPFLQAFHDAGPRRGRALRRRLPLVGSRVGRARSGSVTVSSSSTTSRVQSRSGSNATRRRCCSSSPMQAAAARAFCRGRSTSTSQRAVPSSRSSLPTARRPSSFARRAPGVVVAPDDVEGITDALVELHARFTNGGLPSVELAKRDEDRLSRRARVEEMAALVEEIA